MTISNTASSVTVLGNGTQTQFNYGFLIPKGSNFALYYEDVNGVVSTLDPATYAVNNVGSTSGGTFEYPLNGGTPIAAGTSLTLSREVPEEQQTSFGNQGAYYPAVVENALDWIVMQIQDMQRRVGRAIAGAPTDSSVPALPSAKARANTYLAFDSSGAPMASPGGSGTVPISSAMSPVVSAAALAAAQGKMGVPMVAASMTAFRALDTTTGPGSVVYLSGYYAEGDGVDGYYFYDSADTTSADNGGTVIVDASARRWKLLLPNNEVNVMSFGAKGDGATDDSAAFAAACATGLTVRVPGRHFKLQEGNIILAASGQGFIGAGKATWVPADYAGGTLLEITTNAGAAAVSVAASAKFVRLESFTLTRSVAAGGAVNGSDGIAFQGNTEQTVIRDIIVDNQANGLSLQSTDYSSVSDVVLQRNSGSGLLGTNTGALATLQWELRDILSSQNSGYGFYFLSQSAGGATQMSMGNMHHLSTYANTGGGFLAQGSSACPVQAIRLSSSFFGQDNGVELNLQTYGSDHYVADTFVELAGTSASGPTLAAAATGTGDGVKIGASDSRVSLSNVYVNGCSNNGLNLLGTQCAVTGCRFTNNGLGSAGGSGIIVNAGAVLSTIGSSQSLNTNGNTTQKFGLYNSGTVSVCVGNEFKTNTDGTFSGTAALIGGATLNNQ